MRPGSIKSWGAVLDMIEWAQLQWPEVEKANDDLRRYGFGYLRITADGIEHIPAERIRIDMPPEPQDEQ